MEILIVFYRVGVTLVITGFFAMYKERKEQEADLRTLQG